MEYRGWMIREAEEPVWPWMRFMARKGEKFISAATTKELREEIDRLHEVERLPWRKEREVPPDTEYIRSALEELGSPLESKLRVDWPGGPAFVFRGPKRERTGWWLSFTKAGHEWVKEKRFGEWREFWRYLPRAVFRSDAYTMARYVVGLRPESVTLLQS